MTAYNIYCDESAHLENDHQTVMVLGAVSCPVEKTLEIANRIREIKIRHRLGANFEIKWTKVSAGKLGFYEDIVDYFFDDDDLGFRALVVPDKSQLDHVRFRQTHDDFYYKMYFDTLKVLLDPSESYYIYLDIKDTCGETKVRKLHEVLANSVYDFQRQIVRRIQQVRSDQIQQLQIADLLIGAISYAHRGLASNPGKVALIERIKKRSRYNLMKSTLLRERKMNLFVWQPAARLSA